VTIISIVTLPLNQQSAIKKDNHMTNLKYTGCSDAQVNYGGHDDPRGVLIEGDIYEQERKDVRDWKTKIKLKGIDGWFNLVCFDEQPATTETGIIT
jgi:hypothetical protein